MELLEFLIRNRESVTAQRFDDKFCEELGITISICLPLIRALLVVLLVRREGYYCMEQKLIVDNVTNMALAPE